jgi:hypothetical protein
VSILLPSRTGLGLHDHRSISCYEGILYILDSGFLSEGSGAYPAARFGNAGGVLLDPLVLMGRLLHKYVQLCISMAMLGTLNNVSWA